MVKGNGYSPLLSTQTIFGILCPFWGSSVQKRCQQTEMSPEQGQQQKLWDWMHTAYKRKLLAGFKGNSGCNKGNSGWTKAKILHHRSGCTFEKTPHKGCGISSRSRSPKLNQKTPGLNSEISLLLSKKSDYTITVDIFQAKLLYESIFPLNVI